ncbi:MAG: hypothetical protein JW939_08260 [Candidatus Thermoplasmatota archaeon]|nr:hypothetical protein [Candidatus Thermoplasmatota archaeon]
MRTQHDRSRPGSHPRDPKGDERRENRAREASVITGGEGPPPPTLLYLVGLFRIS